MTQSSKIWHNEDRLKRNHVLMCSITGNVDEAFGLANSLIEVFPAVGRYILAVVGICNSLEARQHWRFRILWEDKSKRRNWSKIQLHKGWQIRRDRTVKKLSPMFYWTKSRRPMMRPWGIAVSTFKFRQAWWFDVEILFYWRKTKTGYSRTDHPTNLLSDWHT